MKSRYESQGALGDLEEAILLHQQALELLPVGHIYRPGSLFSIANCMQCRYYSQGALGDLEEAISLHQQALELFPVSHPNRPSSLGSLAICMQLRYDSLGALEDLEEAISLHQQAFDLFPVSHPDRPSSLNNFAKSMQSRYYSLGVLGDLDEAISLDQEALELFPVCHPHIPNSLCGLASSMKSKYDSQGALGDLEEAISLHQQALKLFPVNNPIRPCSLISLANCMKSRYESQGALGDLEEAILLHQQALELLPVSHPNRPSSLCGLACCMKSRYHSLGALGDLEEAISLLQHALDLHSPCDARWTSIARNLGSCFEYRIEPHVVSSHLPPIIFPAAYHLISSAIQEILHSIPPRLVQTDTGILLSHGDMKALFYQQPQYQVLVNSLEEGGNWHSSLNHMKASIGDYFKYATLSHRWGSNEPLLQDILGHGSIYDMSFTDGLAKLIMFCCTASHHGYSWAWSDTCCIDKTNSVELQEAIGSMFSCVWFRRGWTLQELLAPKKMLFYVQDWSPCMNSTAQNHKQDVHILNALKQATGIPCQYLSNFHPSMDNARLKLQWATTRQTTRPEDIAYSLFGMFNLHLPVLYGEGKEKSLIRLLQEVLSHTCDISILHWAGKQSSFHSCFPANISPYQ
ncbi:hypothetical protein ID866_11219, partial [Astraeus odoratus]